VLVAGAILIAAGAPGYAAGPNPMVTFKTYYEMTKVTGRPGIEVTAVMPFNPVTVSAQIPAGSEAGGFENRMILDGDSWQSMSPEQRHAFLQNALKTLDNGSYIDEKDLVFVVEVPSGNLWALPRDLATLLDENRLIHLYTAEIIDRLPLSATWTTPSRDDRRTNDPVGDGQDKDLAISTP
jgi:hypothetical protein